jgi:hypothetical protein
VSGIAVLAPLSAGAWRLSTLVRMSPTEPLASVAIADDPSFAFVSPEGHYDGVYFYAIARDPLALGDEHTLIDRAAYRYGHAGYGWLAWLASGGGRPAAVPAALLGLNLLGMAVAAFGASRLSREFGWSGWGGLAVAFNPGLIGPVTFDTSEPVGIAVLVLALLAWKRERLGLAAVGLAVLCLMKEPYLLVPAGLLLWEGIRWLRGGSWKVLLNRVPVLALGPAAFAVWYLYLRSRFGHWPFTENPDFFTAPFAGWLDTFRQAAGLGLGGYYEMQSGAGTIPLLALVAAMLIVGLVRALRLRTWLDTIFILFFILASMLNWLALLFPKDMPRELVVPFLLLPAVLATPKRLGEIRDSEVNSRE